MPFACLEASVIISGAGNGVAVVALPWLVLERTGNPAAAGIMGAATAFPLLLSSLFSGSVADTLGRRATSIVADVLSAISVAAIPFVDATIGLNLPLFVLLAAIGAVFDPAGATAREAMLPDVAARAGMRLERANGIHEAAWGVAYMVGPGVGGLLIATIGAGGALWATSLTFLVSVLLIAFLRTPGVGRPATHERPTGILRGSLEGLSFVWRDRVLRTLTVLTMVIVAIYLPIEGVILPVVFEEQGAAGRLGGTLMALSGGGVAGSLLYGAVAQRFSRRSVLIGSLVGAAAAILAISLLPPYPLLVAAAALAGFFWGPFGPLLNLRMQTFTPPAMRGRVLGILIATEYAAGPAAYLLVGWLVARFGPETVFLGTGILMVAACLGFAALPTLKHLDDEGPYSAELQPPDIKPPAV